MSNNRSKYSYHMVISSELPFLIGIQFFFVMMSFIFYFMQLEQFLFKNDLLNIVLFSSMIPLLITWYNNVTNENKDGYHTDGVIYSLQLGFIFFIISEIMLFAGFFWASFHTTLSTEWSLGVVWPPRSVYFISPLEVPLLNTLLLIMSGFSLTFVHYSIINNSVVDVLLGWIVTLYLGILFLMFQITEYYESFYNFNDSTYGCTFFMLTGLHGMHVFVGFWLLFNCFIRYVTIDYTNKNHLSFLFASWYWHFVDIVWILLFLIIYIWSGYYVNYNVIL